MELWPHKRRFVQCSFIPLSRSWKYADLFDSFNSRQAEFVKSMIVCLFSIIDMIKKVERSFQLIKSRLNRQNGEERKKNQKIRSFVD